MTGTIEAEWECYMESVLFEVPDDVLGDFRWTFYAGWHSALQVIGACKRPEDIAELLKEMAAHNEAVKAQADAIRQETGGLH